MCHKTAGIFNTMHTFKYLKYLNVNSLRIVKEKSGKGKINCRIFFFKGSCHIYLKFIFFHSWNNTFSVN